MSSQQQPVPKCSAIILCDHVTKDAASGSYSIFETFDGLNVGHLPGNLPPMTLYFSVNGGRGRMPFKVKISDASGAAIGEVAGQIEFDDPLRDYSGHVVFDGMPVSREGVVLLEVLFGNHMVGSRRLTIKRMPQHVA